MPDGIDTQLALGAYVRREVLPAGISVKDAAESLGVGRPALSNLLNGKATLSPDMATRIERTFGANSRAQIALQDQVSRSSRNAAGL